MTTKAEQQRALFDKPKRHRKRRVMMHVVDAGESCNGNPMAMFECRKCAYRTEWIEIGMAQAKRGLTCPLCNDQGFMP